MEKSILETGLPDGRLPTLVLEKALKFEDAIFRWNTDDLNMSFRDDPLFKRPGIPPWRNVAHFWMRNRNQGKNLPEVYWTTWRRGLKKPRKHRYIIAESSNPATSIEKQSHHHRDLVDSLWVSEGEHPKYTYEMEVEDIDFNLTVEGFENNAYYQSFTESIRNDNNHGNWREKITSKVIKVRMEYYEERYRVSRNDHHLKMALFWRHLDWKILKTEHLSLLCMCYMKGLNLGFVEDVLRSHYS